MTIHYKQKDLVGVFYHWYLNFKYKIDKYLIPIK